VDFLHAAKLAAFQQRSDCVSRLLGQLRARLPAFLYKKELHATRSLYSRFDACERAGKIEVERGTLLECGHFQVQPVQVRLVEKQKNGLVCAIAQKTVGGADDISMRPGHGVRGPLIPSELLAPQHNGTDRESIDRPSPEGE